MTGMVSESLSVPYMSSMCNVSTVVGWVVNWGNWGDNNWLTDNLAVDKGVSLISLLSWDSWNSIKSVMSWNSIKSIMSSWSCVK